MSKTPRTDAELRKPENNTGILIHLAHFTRQLELENADLKFESDLLKQVIYENEELKKDKERLDWLLKNASIAHVCWSIDSREQIDEAMEDAQ